SSCDPALVQTTIPPMPRTARLSCRLLLPRPQPRQQPRPGPSLRRRLPRLRPPHPPSLCPHRHARSWLLPDAESLPPGALAANRRRLQRLDALAAHRPCPPLPQSLPRLRTHLAGPFQSLPDPEDGHLLSVLRYIERNPLRAGLVTRAEDWPWS